jgi:alkaline phosphatase D
VRQMDGVRFDRFRAPAVQNAAIEHYDGLGLGLEPNNLAAIRSLAIHRTLKWGRNADLILTDNRSFQAAQPDGGGPFFVPGFPFMYPEAVNEIFDGGRDYNDGHPPATITSGSTTLPNPAIDYPRQSYLGAEQKAWFLGELRASRKPWKLWGHSFGTLTLRIDAQNLPDGLRGNWPGGYGLVNGGYDIDHGEIADMMKAEGITGLAILAGDKHSFWAGTFQKHLPPKPFEPVGVEFITGSISQVGLAESIERAIRPDHPLRALYAHDGPNGTDGHKINMTMLHGVRSSLAFKETGDRAAALAVRNPDMAPHLKFADYGGHGYATVRVSAAEMETEFVCIPRPLTRAETPDGGPLLYRVIHRVPLWQAGQPPRLIQEVIEGTPPFAT